MVTEEQEKEQQQEEEKRRSGAAPGQVTSLRRLGGRSGAAQAEPERKKRGWGATRGSRLRSGQLQSAFRIRLQIRMSLSLLDRGTNPDPYII